MAIEMKIKVAEIGQLKKFDKFRIRELMGETDEKYPQWFKIDFANDNADKLDGIKVGDIVDVKCYLSGRRWENPSTGKMSYFTSLRAISISVAATEIPLAPAPEQGTIQSEIYDKWV